MEFIVMNLEGQAIVRCASRPEANDYANALHDAGEQVIVVEVVHIPEVSATSPSNPMGEVLANEWRRWFGNSR